jgi:quercetin dioxygenase-like cupin family protein
MKGGSMRRRMRVAFVATALALAALAAGPPLVSAVTQTLFTTSTLQERVKINNGGIKLSTKGPTDASVLEVKFAPGETIGWHTHSGFALVTVKSGTLTLYDHHCRPHVMGPGTAFVEDGDPHKPVNEGSTEVVFYVTLVSPHGVPGVVPVTPPDCTSGSDPDEDSHENDED